MIAEKTLPDKELKLKEDSTADELTFFQPLSKSQMEFIVPSLIVMIGLQVAQLYYLQVFRTDIGASVANIGYHIFCAVN